jgi:hypothetical protein
MDPELLLKLDVGIDGVQCDSEGVIDTALGVRSTAQADIAELLFGRGGVATDGRGMAMGGAGEGGVSCDGEGREDRKVLDRMARTVVTSLGLCIAMLQGSHLRSSTTLVRGGGDTSDPPPHW